MLHAISSFWAHLRMEETSKATQLRVRRILEHSKFHSEASAGNKPTGPECRVICREEMNLGRLLGEGSFAQVYVVSSVALNMESTQKEEYVVKQMKMECQNVYLKEFEQVATDIIMEAAYLSRLYHDNIVRVDGVSPAIHSCLSTNTTQSATPDINDYYFVMERVEETLDERIETWKKEQLNNMAEQSKENNINDPRKALLPVQFQYALQLARVLAFLHRKRIIYRDVKPANVGLVQQQQEPQQQPQPQSQDKILLFDLGACRELPPEHKWDASLSAKKQDPTYHYHHHGSHHEQVFHMSLIGSRRYLAPEVLKEPRWYNAKCDVYGWSILVAHMLTLEEPFEGYEPEEHLIKVVWGQERPVLAELSSHLPHSLEELIRHAWATDLFMRPTMSKVVSHLEWIQKHDLS